MDLETFDADEADALKPIDASVYADQPSEDPVPVIQAPITPSSSGAASGKQPQQPHQRTGSSGNDRAAAGHGGAPLLNAPPVAGGLSRTAPGKKAGR